IKSFKEWVEAGGLPNFHERLNKLIDSGVGTLVLRNLDAISDSVEDFKKICGLESHELTSARANESVGSTELLLRTLFNSQCKAAVLPIAFDRVIGHLDYGETPDSFLKRYVPTAEDLRHVRALATEDKEKLNQLLIEHGQPPLSENEISAARREIELPQLCLALAQSLMSQSVKLERLSIALKKMEERFGAAANE